MPDLIKYLSPVAMLGLVWAIVQFYQKRKDDRRNKKRKEKLAIYSAIHSVLRDLEYELVKFMTTSKIPMLNATQEMESIYEVLENLNERDGILQNKVIILKNKENLSREEINSLESDLQKNMKTLSEIILIKEQTDRKTVKEISLMFENFISLLEVKMEEINKIPLLIIPKQIDLEKSILDLTVEISAILETYGTKKHINDNGFINSEISAHFNELIDIIHSIKSQINMDLN